MTQPDLSTNVPNEPAALGSADSPAPESADALAPYPGGPGDGPGTEAGAAPSPGAGGGPAPGDEPGVPGPEPVPAGGAEPAGGAGPELGVDSGTARGGEVGPDLGTDSGTEQDELGTPAVGSDPGAAPSVEDPAVAASDVGPADVGGAAPLHGVALLEREGDLAADYLETLLDIVDLDGDLDMDIEGDRATVDIVGTGLDGLVGPEGETLDALQELTRLAVHRETGVRSRLMLDIGGFRARRRAELHKLATDIAAEVSQTGTAKSLPAMTPFERKVVHDAVADVAGLESESEGEEPTRFVVIRPA